MHFAFPRKDQPTHRGERLFLAEDITRVALSCLLHNASCGRSDDNLPSARRTYSMNTRFIDFETRRFPHDRRPLITIGHCRECRPQTVFGVKAKVPVPADRSSVSRGPKMDSSALIERARFAFSTKMATSLARSRVQRPLGRSRLNRQLFARLAAR